jgi:phage gpG-like protein
MAFKMELQGIAELRARYQQRAERAADLSVPLERAGAVTVSASKRRFRQNNWAPNTANTIASKGSSQPGMDNGRLYQSITASDPSPTQISIGTNLEYARWFQEGTGEYAGHSDWTIRASGRALRWVGAQGTAYARWVLMRGQPSRIFLTFDQPLVEKIREIFVRWLMLDDSELSGGTDGLA